MEPYNLVATVLKVLLRLPPTVPIMVTAATAISGDQPIFDCRDTRLVLDQLSKKSARWVLLADEHQGPDPDRIGVGQTPIDGILRQVAEDERQKEHSASRPDDDLDYAYVQVEAPWRRSKRNRA